MKIKILCVSLALSLNLVAMQEHVQKHDKHNSEQAISQPLSLKSLALRVLAHTIFSSHPFNNIDSIKNIFSSLSSTTIQFTPKDLQFIVNHYARQLSKLHEPLPLSTVKGDIDRSGITKVIVSPHDKYLAIESYGLFDLANQVLYPLEGMLQHSSLEFSPNDTYLWQWHPDATISIWDTETKKLIKILNVTQYAKPCISLDERYLLVQNSDSKLCIYDILTWSLVSEIPIESAAKNAQFLKDSRVVAIPYDGKICLFEVSSGKKIGELKGKVFALSPDGKYIATENYSDRPYRNSCLSIYDAQTFECLQSYQRNCLAWPIQITFSKDSTKVLTEFFHDGGYSLWDIKQGQILFQQKGSRDNLVIYNDMASVIEIDNLYTKKAEFKDLKDQLAKTMPIKSLSNIYVSPSDTYLNFYNYGENKLYNTSDLEHIPHSMMVNQGYIISPCDTYYITGGRYSTIQVFLLNMIKHFSLNFEQILAFIILEHNRYNGEPLDIRALELLDKTCPHVLEIMAKAKRIKEVLSQYKSQPISYGIDKRFIFIDSYKQTLR